MDHEENSKPSCSNSGRANLIRGSSTSTCTIGQYELNRTLGKGNFSIVKLAKHKLTHLPVAVKVIKTEALTEDSIIKIERETEVHKKLDKHDHIVRLYQVLRTRRYIMLVTEYCTNGDLYEYLVAKGRLSEPKACYYLRQILSAVEFLHDRKIVHRDLKAENILLTNDYKTIKIADFGFANFFVKEDLLATWCGSPPYAAPELYKGLRYVGPPIDVWSLGIVLYVLVCGSLPFDGHNLIHLKGRILSGRFCIPYFMSTDCEVLVRGMLRLNPEKRLTIKKILNHSFVLKNGYCKKSLDQDAPVVYMESTNSNEENSTVADIETNSTSVDINKYGDKKVNHPPVSSNRGQSLDFDENIRANEDSTKTDDEVSLVNLTEPILPKKIPKRDKNNPRIQNTVDLEIANAVSNMSLDSNQSMSQSNDVIMSNQTSITSNDSNRNKQYGGGIPGFAKTEHINQEDSPKSRGQPLREPSLDDQIIDFMRCTLKIQNSTTQIKEAIVRRAYDDVHATYRLIKDNPTIIHDSRLINAMTTCPVTLSAHSNSKKGSILPNLPLTPKLSKHQIAKKHSIPASFFNCRPAKKNSVIRTFPQKAHHQPCSQNYHIGPENRESPVIMPLQQHNSSQSVQPAPMDLVTRHIGDRLCDDPSLQTQHMILDEQPFVVPPPQLFLTPPVESHMNNQQSLHVVDIETSDIQNQASPLHDNGPHSPILTTDCEVDIQDEVSPTRMAELAQGYNILTKQMMPRHSFDSNIQYSHSPPSIGGLSNINQLSLQNSARVGPCMWDSSVFDNLGVLTPPPLITETPIGQMHSFIGAGSQQPLTSAVAIAHLKEISQRNGQQLLQQNLVGVSGNQQQAGQIDPSAHAQLMNQQHLLLAQLNLLSSSSVVTQSGVLSPFFNNSHGNAAGVAAVDVAPIQFTPNNLMNQNVNATNFFNIQVALQNACINRNSSFLDPNWLMNGLERRASDGQASYSSLNQPTSESHPTIQESALNMINTTTEKINQDDPLDLSKTGLRR